MLKILLYPLTLLYGLTTSIRNFLYDSKILKQTEFNIPIISVGNLTVGGTGKTPHAEYLLKLLQKNFKVALLSRGYKRKTKGFVLSNNNSTYEEIGDEPLQIKKKFPSIPVAVCENRVKGVNKLIENESISTDVIVLDDAFQHRRIKPSINILLIDYNNPVQHDHLLPYGRLRESTKGRYRANFIIVTKCPSNLKPIDRRIIKNSLDIRPYQNLFFTSIVYGEITPVIKGSALLDDDMKRFSVLLVTGIANAKPLIEYLNKQVGEITHLNYPDHYHYSKIDVENITQKFIDIGNQKKMIITTEKDMVRLTSKEQFDHEILKKIYYIPIEINFPENTKIEFNKRIINYVTGNKSNSKLFKKTDRV